MKGGGFEPGANELGLGRAESGKYRDEVHVIVAIRPAGLRGQRCFHFREDNDAGAGLEQALNFHLNLLADV